MNWFRHHIPNRFVRLALLAGLAICALILPAVFAGATPAAVAKARAVDLDPRLVRILSPARDAFVTAPRTRIVVQTARPVRVMRVNVGQRSVAMRPTSRGRFVGVASRLRPGRNALRVHAVGWDGRAGSALDAVTYAPRRLGLVRTQAPKRAASPVAVSVRVPRGEVSFRAWLNGKRIDNRFSHPIRGVRSASLSASDHLRYGRNRLRVQVVSDSRLHDRAASDVAVRTFLVPRNRPLVGAGVDRSVRISTSVRLDGRDSRPHLGSHALRYRWRVLDRPAGSKARLVDATAARPRLRVDKHGRYRLALVTHLSPKPLRSGAVTSRADVVTIAAKPVYPLLRIKTNVPMGDVAADCYGMTIGSDQVDAVPVRYPNPSCGAAAGPGIQLLTLHRDTLDQVANEAFADPAALLARVNALVSANAAGGAPIAVISVDAAYFDTRSAALVQGFDSLNQAITKVGGWGYTADSLKVLAPTYGGALIVGVPGWQRGDGFQSASPGYPGPGGLTGFFIEDQNNSFSFQPGGGVVQYKTAYGGGGGPGQMDIAGKLYSMTPAQDPAFTAGAPTWSQGEPYVHLVAVRADAPSVGSPSTGYQSLERAFAVDTIKCPGSDSPTPGLCTYNYELARMRDTLKALDGDRSMLVFVQTVGSVYRFPGGTDGLVASEHWYEVGDALAGVGGSPWVWDNMATKPDAPVNQNAYVLVGGQAIADENRIQGIEAGGQVPDPWTGGAGPAYMQGVLGLNNVGWFTPTHSLPVDSEQPEASFGPSVREIAYGAPVAWRQTDSVEKQNAYDWIMSQADKLNFSGDLRTAYYTGTFNAKWEDTNADLGRLSFDAYKGNKFLQADFDAVKAQLLTELGYVDNVNSWFLDLRTPLVDEKGDDKIAVGVLANNLNKALKPPPNAAAEWISRVAEMLGLAGAVSGEIGEPLAAASEVLENSTELASSTVAGEEGEPITGLIQSKVDQLDLTLSSNTQATFDAMERLRKIIVSDWGKLSFVGAKTANGGPWQVGEDDQNEAKQNIQVGVIRQAYQAMLPTLGRVFQLWPSVNWSKNNRHLDNAIDWECDDGSAGGVMKPFRSSPRSQPASGWYRLALWPEPATHKGHYADDSAKTRPPWTFLIYRLFWDPFWGDAAPSAMTDPLSKPPAPGGEFSSDPTTLLSNPGFYPPWLFSRLFQPIVYPDDCDG